MRCTYMYNSSAVYLVAVVRVVGGRGVVLNDIQLVPFVRAERAMTACPE